MATRTVEFGTTDADARRWPGIEVFGPRPGWGTAIGLLIFAVSMPVWLSAETLVIALMHGGHIQEISVVGAIAAFRTYSWISALVGILLSARVIVGLVQLATLWLLASAVHWDRRMGRTKRRVSRGYGFEGIAPPLAYLTEFQEFLASLPNHTAAFIKSAAVLFWGAGDRSAAWCAAAPKATLRFFVPVLNGGLTVLFGIGSGTRLLLNPVWTTLWRLGLPVVRFTLLVWDRIASWASETWGVGRDLSRNVAEVASLALAAAVLSLHIGFRWAAASAGSVAHMAQVTAAPPAAAVRRAAAYGISTLESLSLWTRRVASVLAEAAAWLMATVWRVAVARASFAGSVSLELLQRVAEPCLAGSRKLSRTAAESVERAVAATGIILRRAADGAAQGRKATSRFATAIGFALLACGNDLAAGFGRAVHHFVLLPASRLVDKPTRAARSVTAAAAHAGAAAWDFSASSALTLEKSALAAGIFAWRRTTTTTSVAWLLVTAPLAYSWRLLSWMIRHSGSMAFSAAALLGDAILFTCNAGLDAARASGAFLGRPIKAAASRAATHSTTAVLIMGATGHRVGAHAGSICRLAGVSTRQLLEQAARVSQVKLAAIAYAAGRSAVAVSRVTRSASTAAWAVSGAPISYGTRFAVHRAFLLVRSAGHSVETRFAASVRFCVRALTWLVVGSAATFSLVSTPVVSGSLALAHTTARATASVSKLVAGMGTDAAGSVVEAGAAVAATVRRHTGPPLTAAATAFTDFVTWTASATRALSKRAAVTATVSARELAGFGADVAGAAAAGLRFLWLGVESFGAITYMTLHRLLRVAVLPWLAVLFVLQTIVVGLNAVPDAIRLGVLSFTGDRKEQAMSEINMTRERLLSMIAAVWVVGVAAFFIVGWLWPAPPPPTVTVSHWVTGHLTREGLLMEMAEEFNSQGHRTADGTLIKVRVFNVPSELIGEYLTDRIKYNNILPLHDMTDGYVVKDVVDPVIVTPSSAHWLVSTNHEVGRNVVEIDRAEPIVRPVIGIVTYEEMAKCLGWPDRPIGFQDIIDLKNHPLGWESRGTCWKAEWGRDPLLAFTDPTTSSTGRSLLLGLYSIAAGVTPESLTLDHVQDEAVVGYVKEFQTLIDHYQIGTTVLNTKVADGPRYGHFFVMPEDNLIHLIEGTETAYRYGRKLTISPYQDSKMVMIYPKEGSMPRNNCACIVSADWVSDQQVEGAHRWIDFIREDDQQRKFMSAGFRPGTDISLTDPASKISPEFGLDPTEPKLVLNPSFTEPEVAAAIDASWEHVKRPGIVSFVTDVSGSMLGNKLEQAVSGLERALDNMATNNRAGLITFESTVNEPVAVGSLHLAGGGGTKAAIAAAAHDLRAGGETALYDAILAGIRAVDSAEGPEDAIRGVVVLTDGQANKGVFGLDDIVNMRAANESPIAQFDGWQNSAPVDDMGRQVPPEQIIGEGLKIETRHKVQIFYIGIGEDADLIIGNILAQATGADLRGVTEDDLAQVLEEFSKYF